MIIPYGILISVGEELQDPDGCRLRAKVTNEAGIVGVSHFQNSMLVSNHGSAKTLIHRKTMMYR
jgi:hypothetical protein